MSVIVRDMQTDKIICYSKGADSILLARLRKDLSSEEKRLKMKTEEYLEDAAKEGLRTLLLVEKVIHQKDYDDWNFRYQEALCSISNREEKLDELANEIERDFYLIGSTAIEDKL
jgi:magnesium-transporting ATPase (P-type)